MRLSTSTHRSRGEHIPAAICPSSACSRFAMIRLYRRQQFLHPHLHSFWLLVQTKSSMMRRAKQTPKKSMSTRRRRRRRRMSLTPHTSPQLRLLQQLSTAMAKADTPSSPAQRVKDQPPCAYLLRAKHVRRLICRPSGQRLVSGESFSPTCKPTPNRAIGSTA